MEDRFIPRKAIKECERLYKGWSISISLIEFLKSKSKKRLYIGYYKDIFMRKQKLGLFIKKGKDKEVLLHITNEIVFDFYYNYKFKTQLKQLLK